MPTDPERGIPSRGDGDPGGTSLVGGLSVVHLTRRSWRDAKHRGAACPSVTARARPGIGPRHRRELGPPVRGRGPGATPDGPPTRRPRTRHRLLEIPAACARSLGVRLRFQTITAEHLPDADLVVAADGAHSALRGRHADHVGTRLPLARHQQILRRLHLHLRRDRPRLNLVLPLRSRGRHLRRRMRPADLDRPRLRHREGGRRPGPAATALRRPPRRPPPPRPPRRRRPGAVAGLPHRHQPDAGTTLALEDAIALAGALHAHTTLPQALAAYEQERKTPGAEAGRPDGPAPLTPAALCAAAAVLPDRQGGRAAGDGAPHQAPARTEGRPRPARQDTYGPRVTP